MPDFAARRRVMVDTQVRPADVTRFPIIDAILAVPREAFVPRDKREMAYVGETLGIARDRVLLEPRTFAKMLEALVIEPDELVLDVAPGLGYSSAVIARLAEAVVALEDDADRIAEAQAIFAEIGADNVILQEGDPAEGAAQHGPYDVILIEGGVEAIPEALTGQLKEGGRIAALFMEGELGAVRIGYKIDGEISWRFAFNASAPVLPGFKKAREFAL